MNSESADRFDNILEIPFTCSLSQAFLVLGSNVVASSLEIQNHVLFLPGKSKPSERGGKMNTRLTWMSKQAKRKVIAHRKLHLDWETAINSITVQQQNHHLFICEYVTQFDIT